MVEKYQIEEFVRQAHRCGNANLMLCSSGNISWRVGNEVIITGTGSWVPSIDKTKVSICDLATGDSMNGVKPSMENPFHFGVLRARPDVNVVLHFQSEYATIVSCMKELPTNFNVTAEVAIHVGAEIPVVPYFRPGSKELGDGVTDALRNHNSTLLRNHGQVVCGKNFDDAYEKAMFFEMACRIIVQTRGEYTVLTEEEMADLGVYTAGKKQ